MQQLNLPSYSFRIRNEDGLDFIFDPYRRKYVRLTPEEWVRQNFVTWLVKERSFPASVIIMEKSMTYNKMHKRCDVLVYDRRGKPVLMIECKAPGVKIRREVFDQIAVYNLVFRVPYLLVTNGLNHYGCKADFDSRKISFLKDIPSYEQLNEGITD